MVANLLTFAALVVRRLRVSRWLRYAAPIGLLIAAAQVLLAFFDRHLKGRAAPLLDRPAERFPDVLFESRGSNATAPR